MTTRQSRDLESAESVVNDGVGRIVALIHELNDELQMAENRIHDLEGVLSDLQQQQCDLKDEIAELKEKAAQ